MTNQLVKGSYVLTAAGVGSAITINLHTFKFGVGIIVTMMTGVSGTWQVDVSGDREGNTIAQGGYPVGPVHWCPHTVLQNQTASAANSLAYPCAYVRLNVLSMSGGNASNTPAIGIHIAVVQAGG